MDWVQINVATCDMTLPELEQWNGANDDILGRLSAVVQIDSDARVCAVWSPFDLPDNVIGCDVVDGEVTTDDSGWLVIDTADLQSVCDELED